MTMLFIVSFMNAQKTDVWDFGAVQLDINAYNNQLDATAVNAWYAPSVTVGSVSNVLPSFTAGILKFVAGSNDRLRTSNTNLTRFDQSLGSVGSTGCTGRVYVNSAAAVGRYFEFSLEADDEIRIIAASDIAGLLNFEFMDTPSLQKDQIATTTTAAEYKFVAKYKGKYRVYDSTQKPSYYRIYKKSASYASISGNLDVTQASGIPSGYSVKFTNAAGKSWTALESSNSYNVDLPIGYTYQVSLLNANGYIIGSGGTLSVTDTTTNHNISIQKIDLFTVTGSITGLGTDILKLSSLTYTPDPLANKIFVPKTVINSANSTYSVELEANTQYTISGQGINDYELLANTITITGGSTADIAFTAKPTYPITINTTGLDVSQINSLTLTFTNLNESGYVYTFAPGAAINLRNGTYTITYSGLNSSVVVMTLTSNLKVNGAATSKTLDFVAPAPTSSLPYASVITVGAGKDYQTINAALAAVARMTTRGTQRVTIMIDPGNYEEMIDITQVNVTLKNAATTPSIALLNKGVDIDPAAVRITSYYGLGYNYYSMKSNQKWDADVLRVNKENGYQPYTNVSGTTNNSYWNATLLISANGFTAEDIIIENSYNQYISKKESEDVVELASGNKGVRSTTMGSTAVQDKAFVERAAAFAVKNGIDKVILNKCRVVGRQDSFFGGTTARVVVYKGVMMGATDYIFGGMNAVFYQTDLAMNTSDASTDVCYITAAQQGTGRGYLMYECKVTTAIPGTETASVYRSKPGYFGRPWAATTSEVVFYNTTIETSNYPANVGQSLILPLGWNNSLGGAESAKMYEYGTIENSGVNNSANRASWATKLAAPTLTDGTAITTFNFTKGSDNWDPIPDLIAADPSLSTKNYQVAESSVSVYSVKNSIIVSNVKSNTKVSIYSLNGSLVKSLDTDTDINFNLNAGVWIVVINAVDGQKVVKVMTY